MNSSRPGTNYYEILEVPPTAPQNEIHRAYQRAKQTYSQDNPALYSMFTKEEARELVRLIEEAYQILGNQGSRRSYDEALEGGGAIEQIKMEARSSSLDQFQPLAESLPDFVTTVESSEEFTVRKRELPKVLPSGEGRTSLSLYKINPEFEKAIAACENWDGTFLQKVREYKNVPLERLSEATRVSRSYLTAVEANDYSGLPAQVFVRGFVAQTARILGLDESKVANSYMKFLKAAIGAKK